MIHLIVDMCSIDMLPTNQSPVYQDILSQHGEGIANAFVYEVIVPPLRCEDG